jgi:hypothetical protein
MFAFSDTILPACLTGEAESCALRGASSVGKSFVSKTRVPDAFNTLVLAGESDSVASDFALDVILELAESLLPPSVMSLDIPGGIFGTAGAMAGVMLGVLDAFAMSGFGD